MKERSFRNTRLWRKPAGARRVSLKEGSINRQSLNFRRAAQSIEAEKIPLKRKLAALTESLRSPGSPLVSPFYTGWEHESLGFAVDWFFRKIVVNKPDKLQYASLGVGNGVKVLINEKILQLFGFKEVGIIGVDLNRQSLRHAAQLSPEGDFRRVMLPAGQDFIDGNSGKFHLVESSNLLHEVFMQSKKRGDGWAGVDSVLRQARKLISPNGGIFLVHDGVLPEHSESLLEARLSPRYARALKVFSKTLPPKSVAWHQQKGNERSAEVALSARNLARFLSKARYLVEPGWRSQYPPKRELRQVYPFASMQEMAVHLLKAGFDAVIAMDYSDKAIRENWERNCIVRQAELPHNYGRFFAIVLPKGINRTKALTEVENLGSLLRSPQLPSLADEEIGRIRVFSEQH
ncbi:MAG: hypothetical protein NT067_02120 [Candidatus Diapherotrites archaeon]|nr:hypothetical protein [Candidatus Diapherotrites archaeon]